MRLSAEPISTHVEIQTWYYNDIFDWGYYVAPAYVDHQHFTCLIIATLTMFAFAYLYAVHVDTH